MPDVRSPILTAQQRERLGEIVRERGLRPVAREIGISREALCGVVAGTNVHNGTLAMTERWLRKLDHEQEAPPGADEVQP
jgi:hypothetical protein